MYIQGSPPKKKKKRKRKTHLQTRLTAKTPKKDFYNYDSSIAFNFSAYPVGRFANEFGYHSMPSLQTWQQAVPPSELYFNSSTIQLRNHHYPSGNLNISNFDNTTKGMGEMTIAAQRWYPVRIIPSMCPFLSFFFLLVRELKIFVCLNTNMTDKKIYKNRSQTRETPWQTSQHGATPRKSSKPIFTNPKSNFTVVGVVFLIANSAPCIGN